MQWQPIDTAPRDGTAVLLYFQRKEVVIRGVYDWMGEGDWESSIQDWMDWMTDDDLVIIEDPSDQPTHWMSLPQTPTE